MHPSLPQKIIHNFQKATHVCAPYLLENGGTIPAIALGVISRDGYAMTHYMGVQNVEDKTPLTAEHYFDLASMTKSMFTAIQILRRVNPDDLYSTHMPEWQANHPQSPLHNLTIGQLLSHTSGLPAVYPFDAVQGDRVNFAMNHNWEMGDNVYSCVNYILLGFLLHRITGHSLLDIDIADLWGDAPQHSLTFTPPATLCCPTEILDYRGGLIQGQVHDDCSYAISKTPQGVGCNAGLFGTMDGVLGFIRQWLGGEILPSKIMESIIQRRGETHGLGWEVKYPHWSGGDTCSDKTICHRGFTGTGLWIDNKRGYGWSLLTNRTYPERTVQPNLTDLRLSVGTIMGDFYDTV